MDVTPYRHTETVVIAASPEEVYDLVSDITRMGEWSPVSTGGGWDGDDRTWFTGTNANDQRTWATKCRVEVAERGREFTFMNCGMDGDMELVRWSYVLTPTADGTELAESWQVQPDYDVFMAKMAPTLDVVAYLDSVVGPTKQGMAETLANVKAAAEA